MKIKKAIYFIVIFLISTLVIVCFSFLTKKQFKKSELSQQIRKQFKKQLKALPVPLFHQILGSPLTKEQLELGRMLFNDPILSRNNDVSCATCHLTNHGFADGNRLNFGALGAGGPTGNNVGKKWGQGVLSFQRFCSDDGFGFYCENPMFRNSLSTINVIYRANPTTDSGLLWDGRFGRLNFQVLLPIHTKEEMCGVNPLPIRNNPFTKKGKLFDTPVTITHSHYFNPNTGKQVLDFKSPPQTVFSVESFRKNKNIVYPSRNECLAIAVAKVRKIPWYKKQFKKIYKSKVTDIVIGKALAAFVSSHVSNKTPYDLFVSGKDTLSLKQLKGLVVFMTAIGEVTTLGDKKIKGAGCAYCHAPPFFGGSQFYNLGIKGDHRSPLSRPNIISKTGSFAINIQTSHGTLPACHVSGVSVSLKNTAPDIGRAIATSSELDCFKFRTPVLRNVIETYPYFHHGTQTGLNRPFHGDKLILKSNFKNISLYALKRAIEYHLRGPIDISKVNLFKPSDVFFDSSFQIDPLIDPLLMQFGSLASSHYYPVKLEAELLEALVDFVAFGLYDKKSVAIGYLHNDLSHPRTVPSGFLPTITRDHGTQIELPPLGKFN